tara:strand:+ start:471 stop:650 length:180 start_codon:yes stop_codon:yes gene_type:complete
VKSGHSEIFAICPYCKHYSRTYNAIRKHLEYHHSNEYGFDECKKILSKLYRVYEKGVKK